MHAKTIILYKITEGNHCI